MEIWIRSRLFWSVLLLCGGAIVLSCRGRHQQSVLPPAEDTFLSYFQSCHSLAYQLRRPAPVQKDENRQLRHPVPPTTEENRQQDLEDACAELERLQQATDALPVEELRRLTNVYGSTVAQAGKSWGELSAVDAKGRESLGLPWDRLERAFRLCRELNGELLDLE